MNILFIKEIIEKQKKNIDAGYTMAMFKKNQIQLIKLNKDTSAEIHACIGILAADVLHITCHSTFICRF